MLRPFFVEDEPVIFSANKAHWTDIGAKDPGSWSPDAANTYQEGVTVPALRLYREGEVNEELLDPFVDEGIVRGLPRKVGCRH